eukprot:EG_transcript_10149
MNRKSALKRPRSEFSGATQPSRRHVDIVEDPPLDAPSVAAPAGRASAPSSPHQPHFGRVQSSGASRASASSSQGRGSAVPVLNVDALRNPSPPPRHRRPPAIPSSALPSLHRPAPSVAAPQELPPFDVKDDDEPSEPPEGPDHESLDLSPSQFWGTSPGSCPPAPTHSPVYSPANSGLAGIPTAPASPTHSPLSPDYSPVLDADEQSISEEGSPVRSHSPFSYSPASPSYSPLYSPAVHVSPPSPIASEASVASEGPSQRPAWQRTPPRPPFPWQFRDPAPSALTEDDPAGSSSWRAAQSSSNPWNLLGQQARASRSNSMPEGSEARRQSDAARPSHDRGSGQSDPTFSPPPPTAGPRDALLGHLILLERQAEHSAKVHRKLLEELRSRDGQFQQLQESCRALQAEVDRWQAEMRPTDKALQGMSPKDLDGLTARMRKAHDEVQNVRQERLMCVICMEQEKEIVFVPCRHKCSCPGCSAKVDHCPLCREPIRDRIQPY